MNFVFDTNVLVSAALSKGSVADQAFEKASNAGKILSSGVVYGELKEVINRDKFKKYLRTIDKGRFLSRFKTASIPTIITRRVSVCRDPKDNMYLELAISGNASCIVTGDPDLLVLHPFENILIISPKEFLERF